MDDSTPEKTIRSTSLAVKINRKFPYMSEMDVEWLIKTIQSYAERNLKKRIG